MYQSTASTAGQPWKVFSAAPHRMMFFAGAVQLVLTLLFWGVELLGLYTALWPPLHITIAPVWVHGFLMLYGLFPFFIFGFLNDHLPTLDERSSLNPDSLCASIHRHECWDAVVLSGSVHYVCTRCCGYCGVFAGLGTWFSGAIQCLHEHPT